jgi:flagellar biosynthesis/type III secretory pathway ATPase
MMGAYAAGTDSILDEAIARQSDMIEFIRQPLNQPLGCGGVRDVLIEGFGQ